VSVDIQVHDDPARVVGELLIEAAAAGRHIALSGGSTVGAAFEVAAAGDWRTATVWWGDERCVPPNDERSNYRLAKEQLFDRLAAKPEIHRIQGELPPEAAAEAYDAELEGVSIDLALNGIGPDGHTASLFPGSPQLAVRDRSAVSGPPGLEPFVDRVTLTIPALNAIPTVVYLVSGEAKAEAVRRAFADAPDPATPASLVRGAERTLVVLDRAAASLLDTEAPPHLG
jgi:6-phosphogluconolactonase